MRATEAEGLEPVVGIEPTTYGLRNRCSATELHWQSESGGYRRSQEPGKDYLGGSPEQSVSAQQALPPRPSPVHTSCGQDTGFKSVLGVVGLWLGGRASATKQAEKW